MRRALARLEHIDHPGRDHQRGRKPGHQFVEPETDGTKHHGASELLRRYGSASQFPALAGVSCRNWPARNQPHPLALSSAGGRRCGEKMDFLRGRREGHALTVNDPAPIENIAEIRGSAADTAMIGIFLLALAVALYFSRPILLPITAAFV